ncbi:MAG: hypothetical protein FJX59_14360 [Alphaproteobacteria bacterium]|nr:hypothetical protein [Alphaproteobacteria bacterium]
MTTGRVPSTDQKTLDALKPYALCGMPNDGRPIPENARPCDTVRWSLSTKPMEPRQPTEKELALHREFERAYAIENSPVHLPCAGGGLLNPLCLISGMLNGFDFEMGSYAGTGGEVGCSFDKGGSRLCGMASSKPTVGGKLGR